MDHIATKRIMADMKELHKEPLDKDGIYHHFNPDNLTEARFMIIGPEGTPYHNGFYLFYLKFPPNYPFVPPRMTYCTVSGNMRFNPNLYADGKVCLSILNTWEGPKWTSCCTVRTIMLTLRALVLGTAYPLQNEPGYEHNVSADTTMYNDMILHENFRVAVVRMLTCPPKGFEMFQTDMYAHVKTNLEYYQTMLSQLQVFNQRHVVCRAYNLSIRCDYTTILKDLTAFMKRKTPLESAKEFPVGHTAAALYDGRMYIVQLVGPKEKAFKRWVLLK